MIAPTNPMIRCPSQHTGGFLLMEVMIAVAMFAFGVVGLATALNRIMDVELVARSEHRIRLELESRLAEIRLVPLTPESRALEPDVAGIGYQLDIEELVLENLEGVALQGLFKVRITASDPARRGETLNFVEIYALQQ